MYKNILNCDFKVPNSIIVLGSGPKGEQIARNLDTSKYIICTNSNLLLPKKPSIHIVKDKDIPLRPWWKDVENINCTKVYSRLVPNNIKRDYTFDRSELGKINSQTTISGVALHMAAILGAKKITLCGIDMIGQNNFDRKNVRRPYDLDMVRPRVQKLIDYIKDFYGVEFDSLTETTLKL